MNDPLDLAVLFPHTVRVVGRPLAGASLEELEAGLFPIEARAVEGAVAKRRLEFAMGRACAREALAALGVAAEPIEVGKHGAPRWPRGVAGSISHSDASCAAVVARESHCRALGLDLEAAEGLDPTLWPSILSEQEKGRVQSTAEPARQALTLFAAKEAVFKAQHAISEEWLDFLEVEVDLEAGTDRFAARLLRAIGPWQAGTVWDGRIAFAGRHVCAGVALPPE